MALDHDLEPSHKLADLAAQMCEDQALLYIPWDSCTKRSQELFGRKYAADGMQPVADMTSDLKVKQALQRRGVALEMAQLMTFEAHQKIIDHLFLEIMREPVPGFRNATFEQAVLADHEIWRAMAEKTTAGLLPDALGRLPLDTVIDAILASPRIALLLLPVQTNANASSASSVPPPTLPPGAAAVRLSRRQKKAARGAAMKEAAVKQAANSNKGSGKGKDKGKKTGMPEALKNMPQKLDGVEFCFRFNLDGCPDANCRRLHKCGKCHSSEHGWKHCPKLGAQGA
jgi:hypothetical protein